MSDVGVKDRVHIIISGIADVNGQGRTAKQVDYDAALAGFLEEYGEGATGAEAPNLESLTALAGQNEEKFKAEMASLTANMLKSGGKALSQRIVDATCRYLETEHQFVITDKDPGKEVFYIAKADLMPTEVKVPKNGSVWTVLAAAPYGVA